MSPEEENYPDVIGDMIDRGHSNDEIITEVLKIILSRGQIKLVYHIKNYFNGGKSDKILRVNSIIEDIYDRIPVTIRTDLFQFFCKSGYYWPLVFLVRCGDFSTEVINKGLIFATISGNLEIIEFLMRIGGDINGCVIADTTSKIYLSQLAIARDHKHVIKFLIDNGKKLSLQHIQLSCVAAINRLKVSVLKDLLELSKENKYKLDESVIIPTVVAREDASGSVVDMLVVICHHFGVKKVITMTTLIVPHGKAWIGFLKDLFNTEVKKLLLMVLLNKVIHRDMVLFVLREMNHYINLDR